MSDIPIASGPLYLVLVHQSDSTDHPVVLTEFLLELKVLLLLGLPMDDGRLATCGDVSTCNSSSHLSPVAVRSIAPNSTSSSNTPRTPDFGIQLQACTFTTWIRQNVIGITKRIRKLLQHWLEKLFLHHAQSVLSRLSNHTSVFIKKTKADPKNVTRIDFYSMTTRLLIPRWVTYHTTPEDGVSGYDGSTTTIIIIALLRSYELQVADSKSQSPFK